MKDWRFSGFSAFPISDVQTSRSIPSSKCRGTPAECRTTSAECSAPPQNAVPPPVNAADAPPQAIAPPQVANFQSVPLQPGILDQVAGLHLPEPAQGVGVQGPQSHVAPGGVGPAVVQGHGMNNVKLDANFAMNVAAMADQRAFLSLQTCCRLAKA